MVIVAAWLLPLPAAVQVLITVFGSLSCLAKLIRFISSMIKAYKETNEPQRTGNKYLDRYLDRY